MKTSTFAILCLLSGGTALAGSRTSASYSILTDSVDAAGSRAVSANYTNAGSASVIAGTSTNTAPAETAKSGYAGQLFEVAGLLVNAAEPNANEGASLQLAAWQLLDDATLLAVAPTSVTWGIVSGPVTGVSVAGLATAGLTYQNTSATVQGTFGGFTGSLNFTVLDSIPDNFGVYAGDGIGDNWQVQYFGQNNPLAAPALDPDGDGQTNQFEFTAGLVPNDPASVFHMSIAPVPSQPSRKNITFTPRLNGRTYTVQSRLTLGAQWQPLSSSTQSDNGNERTVTDLDATGVNKFYRVEITRP